MQDSSTPSGNTISVLLDGMDDWILLGSRLGLLDGILDGMEERRNEGSVLGWHDGSGFSAPFPLLGDPPLLGNLFLPLLGLSGTVGPGDIVG